MFTPCIKRASMFVALDIKTLKSSLSAKQSSSGTAIKHTLIFIIAASSYRSPGARLILYLNLPKYLARPSDRLLLFLTVRRSGIAPLDLHLQNPEAINRRSLSLDLSCT